MNNIDNLCNRLIEFRNEREWSQFHTPKNLIMALSGEVGELSSLVQWMTDIEIMHNQDDINTVIADGMADIFIYLINLSNNMDIDLIQAASQKINENERRYPVELCKGKSTKADKL